MVLRSLATLPSDEVVGVVDVVLRSLATLPYIHGSAPPALPPAPSPGGIAPRRTH